MNKNKLSTIHYPKSSSSNQSAFLFQILYSGHLNISLASNWLYSLCFSSYRPSLISLLYKNSKHTITYREHSQVPDFFMIVPIFLCILSIHDH